MASRMSRLVMGQRHHFLRCIGQLHLHRVRLTLQCDTRFSKFNATRTPEQQGRIEFALEPMHAACQAWLRDVECFRRLAQAPAFANHQKLAQPGQIHDPCFVLTYCVK